MDWNEKVEVATVWAVSGLAILGLLGFLGFSVFALGLAIFNRITPADDYVYHIYVGIISLGAIIACVYMLIFLIAEFATHGCIPPRQHLRQPLLHVHNRPFHPIITVRSAAAAA